MEKTYKIKNLECAHCALKMERALGKISGVENVSINFMTQKLLIEAEEDKFSDIIDMARKAVSKIEKQAEIVQN
ncbi:MAG: heavy-metal-associated domain-containing protein [Clostridiales bacterium]|nr:heavy-metal-associated domain-containing protein [Clostridiales bacterium]